MSIIVEMYKITFFEKKRILILSIKMVQPDITVYYSNSASNNYEILASSASWKEKISNVPVYADFNLTIPIGNITTTLLKKKGITLFSANVIFTVVNGAINYANSELSPTKGENVYVDTITSGNGDFTFVDGYVISIFDPNSDTVILQFYFNKVC